MTPLSARALNRATLERQLLLRRWELDVPQVLERLVGLQAQTPHTWYVGLWTRLVDYTPERTCDLLREAGVVRIALMRSTIHLVTAADCLWLRPLVEPVIERSTLGSFGRDLAGLDRAELAAVGRELLGEKPLTFSELGRALAERWSDRDPAAMAQGVRSSVPLVQVPPRGLWGRSGRAAHTPVEAWLGRPVEQRASVQRLVLRYLAAFGPATVRDVQQWCGLTRLAEVIDGLRPQLTVFRDEQGRELYDLPDAPRPHPDTPAPVRFLYDFDNLLLSHADRTRVLTVSCADQGFAGTMEMPRAVLVDGFVAATWRVATKRDTATLTVRPFRSLTATEREDIVDEGARLLAFTAVKAATRDIVFEPPQPG
ncbi:winged helix DNA-binding domain-containing protein [Kitasatospora sp. NBC_01287]|uniref:winged helix DNA-binding domain-containing protein n=1 Tax=Kitasatospora sp. NBC_01287 TaxID=2903573 RepID=UPI00225C0A6A|nr:winged helix DNA-binding domain-containing protein [Kitasatospora sp. NBC_01287]MCX4747996.1 winged helix DNA-binding domain-containing protein [Kitasatospora sp. NBC_01287]